MPTTDCATDIAPPPSPTDEQIESAPASGGASKLLKGLLIGFAATVTIGLALGIWYLGVRIVAVNGSAQKQSTAAPLPSVGEFYLQVGAFGPERDEAFSNALQAKGFLAQIQTRDAGHNRILIGPFLMRSDLDQARQKLQSDGILAVETAR
jgi:cell division protein FtsN